MYILDEIFQFSRLSHYLKTILMIYFIIDILDYNKRIAYYLLLQFYIKKKKKVHVCKSTMSYYPELNKVLCYIYIPIIS